MGGDEDDDYDDIEFGMHDDDSVSILEWLDRVPVASEADAVIEEAAPNLVEPLPEELRRNFFSSPSAAVLEVLSRYSQGIETPMVAVFLPNSDSRNTPREQWKSGCHMAMLRTWRRAQDAARKQGEPLLESERPTLRIRDTKPANATYFQCQMWASHAPIVDESDTVLQFFRKEK